MPREQQVPQVPRVQPDRLDLLVLKVRRVSREPMGLMQSSITPRSLLPLVVVVL